MDVREYHHALAIQVSINEDLVNCADDSAISSRWSFITSDPSSCGLIGRRSGAKRRSIVATHDDFADFGHFMTISEPTMIHSSTPDPFFDLGAFTPSRATIRHLTSEPTTHTHR
jgi:hypothetical protein